MIEKTKFQTILAPALFISVLVFLHLPIEIYSRNPQEFELSLATIVPGLLIGVAVLTFTLFIPALLPLQKWRFFYALALRSLFIALWVSSVFLVIDFGEFDGGSFDIAKHSTTMNWHLFIFVLILATCFYLSVKRDKALGYMVNIIGLGLILISTYNFYLSRDSAIKQWSPMNIESISRFSSEKNLIIIMMDSFQSDAFPELLSNNPAMASELTGFTYYPDTLGVAPSTYLTMPAFHSGLQYNNMMAVKEFYDIGVRNGSFLVELASNGYQVDLINPIIGACPRGFSQCSAQENLLLSMEEVAKTRTLRLLDLGVLRAAPGRLKEWVFDGTNGPFSGFNNKEALSGLELRISQANAVLQTIADNIWVNDSAPTARLIHLLNTHPPYMFDKACQFIGVKNRMNRRHMINQIDCGMSWFIYLLNSLKANDVYDNTMIILVADTGVGNIWADTDLSSKFAQEHGLKPGELGRVIGGANPVLAIKFPAARDPFSISDTQAQLTDIPKTVCSALGDCSFDSGINLYEDQETGQERVYQYYKWSNDYWGLSQIPGIVEYHVSGPLWLQSSWTRNLSNMAPVEITNVTFSPRDPLEIFGLGWGQPETNAQGTSKRWAISKHAELFIHLPREQNLVLRFRVMNAHNLDGQTMSLFINGVKVGEREVIDRVHRISFEVPGDLVGSEISEIVLEFARLTESEPNGRRRISVSVFDLEIFSMNSENQ